MSGVGGRLCGCAAKWCTDFGPTREVDVTLTVICTCTQHIFTHTHTQRMKAFPEFSTGHTGADKGRGCISCHNMTSHTSVICVFLHTQQLKKEIEHIRLALT